MQLLRNSFGCALLMIWSLSALAFSGADSNLITPNTIRSDGPFRLIRSEEDYRYLRGKTDLDFEDRLKFISLSSDDSWYVSTGGEWREKFETESNENWGKVSKNDTHLFHRFMTSSDFHFGDYTRVFAELQSALVSFGSYSPKPIDLDRLDLNQLFFDQKFHLGDSQALTFRLGRQELDYGSERLISVREGPNARVGFDGVKAWLNTGDSRFDAFWVMPVITQPNSFDNESSLRRQLWALYWTQSSFDVYYIGNRTDSVVYNTVAGDEVRHSVGARVYKTPKAQADFDLEAVEQFGSIDRRPIEAWTVAADTGWTFNETKLSPRAALKLASASGQKANTNAVGTFNALYPRGAYLDLSTLIGPTNFVSINPYVNLHPSSQVSLAMGYNWLWRESTADGLYNPGMGLVRDGQGKSALYIGSEASITANWTITKNINILTGYAHLFAGDFIRQSGPADGSDYFSLYTYFIF